MIDPADIMRDAVLRLLSNEEVAGVVTDARIVSMLERRPSFDGTKRAR